MGVVKIINRDGVPVFVRRYLTLGGGLPGRKISRDQSVVVPVYGCTDPLATNHNPLATHNDGSCTYPAPILGCTDPLATNYNHAATQDNGSCTYPPPPPVETAAGIVMFSEAYRQELIKRTKGISATGYNFLTPINVGSRVIPGEWKRIANYTKNATTGAVTTTSRFVTNWKAKPGYSVFTGSGMPVNGLGNVVVTDDKLTGWPDETDCADLRDAAFMYWLDPTKTECRDYVKAHLIAQANQPNFDFSNTTRWKPGVLSSDGPPIMFFTRGLSNNLFAFDLVGFKNFDGYDTPNDLTTEFGKIKKFFRDAAIYLNASLQKSLDGLFTTNMVRNGNIGAYTYSSTGSGTSSTKRFKNDPVVHPPSIGFYYNNRRVESAVFNAHYGYTFNHQPSIDCAVAYFKESVAYMCCSVDMLPMELMRSTITAGIRGAKGWQYVANTYNSLLLIAWMGVRAGDNTCRDFSTTLGVGATAGVNAKSLRAMLEAYSELRTGERKLYCRDDPNSDYRNVISPRIADLYNGVQDACFSVGAMLYPTSAKIKAAAYAFPGPLPSLISGAAPRGYDSNGGNHPFQGAGAELVSGPLCWAYMDGISITD